MLSSYAQGVFFIWELHVGYRLFSFYFLLLTLIVLLINEVTDISADSYTPSPFLSLTQSLAEPISCVLSATYLFPYTPNIPPFRKYTPRDLPLFSFLAFISYALRFTSHDASRMFAREFKSFFFFLLLLVFSSPADSRTGSLVLILVSYSR